MPLTLDWQQIALRLALSVLAGTLIGINRTEHGRPAGLRTSILVCLAACFAMVQANLLLGTVGKRQDSFVVLDLMRLPLGILSGMGFIGAGAILRKGDLVVGVTTAATLWFITVIGLCFGGGQIVLGAVGTLLGIFVLWLLYFAERLLPRDRQGSLFLTTSFDTPTEGDIRTTLAAEKCNILASGQTYKENPKVRKMRFEVRWRARSYDTQTPKFVEQLSRNPTIQKLQWKASP